MDHRISIHCLPDEIINMVLELNDINEIVSFSLTCKRFYELLNSNQRLWKEKFKTLVPEIYKTAEKYCNGYWADAFKGFMRMRHIIYKELMKMSPKYYRKKEDITMHDIRQFYSIAFNDNLSFYYTIYILQDLIITVNENTSQHNTKKPFTLTEMHYARIILRHLIHSYLCVKWVRHQNEFSLPPENVVNYFLQWMDTHNIHYMEDVEEKTVINATDLLGFLSGGGGGDGCPFSPYDNFYSFLYQNIDLLKLDSDLDIKYLTNKELEIIFSLLRLNPVDPEPPSNPWNDKFRRLMVKRRRGNVLYAVGMICCHKIHNYVCVIQGWDNTAAPGRNVNLEKLGRGYDQPFYDVIAADNSERYVAEENLVALADPTRLKHIEEFVGKQFTYFDGFSYLLSDEKILEYPEEGLIVDAFRRRFHKLLID